jgi:hypothetical protein
MAVAFQSASAMAHHALCATLSLQRHLIHSRGCLYSRVWELLDLGSLRVLSDGRGTHGLPLFR